MRVYPDSRSEPILPKVGNRLAPYDPTLPRPHHTCRHPARQNVRREVASFKRAVLHRKNALFYRTLNGAQVGARQIARLYARHKGTKEPAGEGKAVFSWERKLFQWDRRRLIRVAGYLCSVERLSFRNCDVRDFETEPIPGQVRSSRQLLLAGDFTTLRLLFAR
jgi:hypothetical protein